MNITRKWQLTNTMIANPDIFTSTSITLAPHCLVIVGYCTVAFTITPRCTENIKL